MTSKRIQLILRVGIFLAFVAILLRMVDVSMLREIAGQVRIHVVGLAILIYFVNIAIRAYRWKRIFSAKGPRMSLKDAYIMTLVGVALNMIIPSTLGDIARSYYGYKRYGFKEEMLSTVLADKMFALCSLFLLGGVSGYWMGYRFLGTVSWVAALLTFIPIAFPGLIPWHWVNLLLKVVKRSFNPDRLVDAFTLSLPLKAEIMLISLAGWFCTCVYFYVICSAFPVTVSLWYVVVIMPMLTIVRLFPFTVNALGPMEVAVAYFFSRLGIHATLAVLVSLTSNLISSLIPGSIGLLFLVMLGKATNKTPPLEHQQT